jgi:hypothetical protein
MLLRFFLLSVHFFLVLGGEFPAPNGIIGGPYNATRVHKPVRLALGSNAAAQTTPGKLRVTENSGICGELWFALKDFHVA